MKSNSKLVTVFGALLICASAYAGQNSQSSCFERSGFDRKVYLRSFENGNTEFAAVNLAFSHQYDQVAYNQSIAAGDSVDVAILTSSTFEYKNSSPYCVQLRDQLMPNGRLSDSLKPLIGGQIDESHSEVCENLDKNIARPADKEPFTTADGKSICLDKATAEMLTQLSVGG